MVVKHWSLDKVGQDVVPKQLRRYNMLYDLVFIALLDAA